MELSSNDSRNSSQDLIPVLQKFHKQNHSTTDIYITKNPFKIGRARDNDEVISSLVISRHHCVFESNENGDWVIRNFSTNGTIVNGEILGANASRNVSLGDVVQFSTAEDFKYYFTLRFKDAIPAKRRKTEEVPQVLSRDSTFSDYLELKRQEIQKELESKRKEQTDLKQLLEECLTHQETDDHTLITERINCLKTAINTSEKMEQILDGTYNFYLKEMGTEKKQFDAQVISEVKHLQKKFKPTSTQIESLVSKKMDTWMKEHQNKWSEIMKGMMKEERIKLDKLENENLYLAEKLKKAENALVMTEEALREKSTLAAQLLEKYYQAEKERDTKTAISGSKSTDDIASRSKNTIVPTVVDILDDQLSCSICSEIFVNPTVLNCNHTFCEHCIGSWKRKNRQGKCPICRKKIKSMNQSLVFDGLIEKIVVELSPELSKRRQQLIDERKTTR